MIIEDLIVPNNGSFYFKQGSLQSADFTIGEKLPNRTVDLDINNVDNNDVWLYPTR